jgi:hypothetical protein
MNIANSYVPILRLRTAEINALGKLFPHDRENMTPLIEFIMPAPSTDKNDRSKIIKTPKDKFLANLPDIPSELLKSWGKNPIFVDVHMLDAELRAPSLKKILELSSELDIFSIPVTYIIPVTSTQADADTRAVAIEYAKTSGRGLCIRIDRSHLSDKNISSHITEFVTKGGLDISNVDLLIDLRTIEPNTDAETIANQLAQLPDLGEWRSFIVAGGVFPKDLTAFAPGAAYSLKRLDWKLWNDIQKTNLSRKPTFSDYTIQHPVYEYVQALGSASIRYTADDEWWIFRGTKPGSVNKITNEKGPGREQYIDHARTLVKRNFYKKETHCFGDAEINRIAAENNKNPGNPGKWLEIGINHHLTLVVRQLASLAENTAAHS